VHAQYRTPVVCTLTVGSFSAILSAFVPLDVLGDMTSMGTLAAFIVRFFILTFECKLYFGSHVSICFRLSPYL
jgi:amino acid transporter